MNVLCVENKFKLLRHYMVKAASSQTAYQSYKKEVSPLHNHCGCCSYVAQKILGGTILRGKVNDVMHYWNLLPDGTKLDFTSDQFGGDGFHPIADGKPSPIRKTINVRYKLFHSLVTQEMAN